MEESRRVSEERREVTEALREAAEEELVLAIVAQAAREAGAKRLTGIYLPTKKNALDFDPDKDGDDDGDDEERGSNVHGAGSLLLSD